MARAAHVRSTPNPPCLTSPIDHLYFPRGSKLTPSRVTFDRPITCKYRDWPSPLSWWGTTSAVTYSQPDCEATTAAQSQRRIAPTRFGNFPISPKSVLFCIYRKYHHKVPVDGQSRCIHGTENCSGLPTLVRSSGTVEVADYSPKKNIESWKNNFSTGFCGV